MRVENSFQRKSARSLASVALLLLAVSAFAQTGGSAPFNGHPPVMGSASCASSGCHGGAGEKSCQVVIWSQRDVHSRSYATLTTSRALRMAEALAIKDPAQDARCTTCHAPLQTVPAEMRASDALVTEGVSCVSCHGMGDEWIRSHTRTDFTKADRFAAGLRDVHNLAGRAGACVACHQNIEPAIVNIGKHPALIFELDGQTQSEPKHWKEDATLNGGQAWFVGQAVALREVNWALTKPVSDPTSGDLVRDAATAKALAWLLQRSGIDFAASVSGDGTAAAVASADQVAQRAAKQWSPETTATVLRKLAATSGDFRAADATPAAQAVRAERLVLALDRLLAATPQPARPAGSSAQLDKLFKLAQSQPDFVPADFAKELAGFAATIGN